MIAQVISVGTELLMGQVLDTNAQFIARQLNALGITHNRRFTVGDNPDRLKEAYELALAYADVVITSGGLGPTGDDITKRVLADLLGEPLVLNEDAQEHLEGYFKNRLNRPMAQNNLSQAMFTAQSIILPNPNGTAPGAIVPCTRFGQGKVVIHLPGPPYEMEPMFNASVTPYLQKRSGLKLVSRYIRIFGMGESDVDMRLRGLMDNANPSLSPYCSLGEVQLRATALCSTTQEGESMLEPVIAMVRHCLPDVIYAVNKTEEGSMQETVSELLKHKGLTLSVCESLTGGMLAALMVSVPGASEIFAGGFVSYTNAQKVALAGVSSQTLEIYGAVSEQCAREMAQGTLLRTKTDMAVSLTGCAGPDTDERQTPIGLIYIGLATKDGVNVKSFQLSGSRERIRTLACLHALNMIRLQTLN